MLLKWVTHYFTSRSLENHRRNTEWKLKEYEQQAASVQKKLETQAGHYQTELEGLAQQREAELKQLEGQLETHAIHTTSYVEQLAELQTRMLGCLEIWLAKLQVESRLDLQRERIQGVRSDIELLLEMAEDIRRLANEQGRKEWRAIVEIRPPRVNTPEIREHIRRFDEEFVRDGQDFQRELRRLLSQVRTLKVRLRTLRETQATIRDNDLVAAKERFQQSRKELLEHFHACRAVWTSLLDELVACYCSRPVESDLANEWMAATEKGGTYHELQQILRDAQQRSDELDEERDSLRKRMDEIKTRVNAAHQNQDYSDLDGLKTRRSSIFTQLQSTNAQSFQVRQAMKELRVRRTKIREFRTLIERLHPAKTVENIFERVGKDDPDVYWKAIGLSTKTLPRPVKETS
ncbi:hypothetical protein QZM93_37905 [Burkholderia cepacia]|uniref:hypothetical protein n=1 Tax=Burkholderia cepacia TaxID=292 RepID=UPI0011AD2B2C|nr:hypothetical protein [Burkholderia cepacia]MDN7894380.1 hypothetical protein [Burkholderia cepacia]